MTAFMINVWNLLIYLIITLFTNGETVFKIVDYMAGL